MATNDDLPRKVRLQTLAHAIAAFPPPVSESPMSRSLFKTNCRYCGSAIVHRTDVTIDHVIPQWALRAVPRLRAIAEKYLKDGRKVKACRPCNTKKGSMPLDVFLEVRKDRDRLNAMILRWNRIAQRAYGYTLGEEDKLEVLMAFGGKYVELEFPETYRQWKKSTTQTDAEAS